MKLSEGQSVNTIYNFALLTGICLSVILYHFMKQNIIVLATSFTGAYFAIRGLSMVLGKFPDESMMTVLIQKEEFNQLDIMLNSQAYYYYLFAIGLITTIGLFIQYVYRPKNEEVDNKEMNEKLKEENKEDIKILKVKKKKRDEKLKEKKDMDLDMDREVNMIKPISPDEENNPIPIPTPIPNPK